MATASPAAIDEFLDRFTSQVGSGFGLIQGDVQGVFAILMVISIGLSALLWALDEHQNVPAALIRRIMLFGFFAWLITGWRSLSLVVVNGFAALGLKAGGGSLGLADLMQAPSTIVTDGLTVAFELLKYIGRLSGEGLGTGFFVHFDAILVAAIAAVGIILAFLILAVEIAITIIEFHIVTLIAFVTVPFGILTQTAFLSERAIGYVVSVGLKLMALALIVSIGEDIFTSYTVSADPTWEESCGLLLAALVMVMLALKIPSIAAALISGGPQLSTGSAVSGAAGLAAAVGGVALAGRVTGLGGSGGKAAAAMQAGSTLTGASGAGRAAGASAGSGGPDVADFRRAPVASVVAQAKASFRRPAQTQATPEPPPPGRNPPEEAS